MFVFWSRPLVVLLAVTLAIAFPAPPIENERPVKVGHMVDTNSAFFLPPGRVSISPNLLWFRTERRIEIEKGLRTCHCSHFGTGRRSYPGCIDKARSA